MAQQGQTPWYAYEDESGATYYMHSETQETLWELPEDVKALVEGAAAAFGGAKVKAGSASGWGAIKNAVQSHSWQVVDDPDSGSQYYYNNDTHETSWDKPAEVAAAEAADGGGGGEAAAAEPAAAELAAEPASAPAPAPAPAPEPEPEPEPTAASEPQRSSGFAMENPLKAKGADTPPPPPGGDDAPDEPDAPNTFHKLAGGDASAKDEDDSVAANAAPANQSRRASVTGTVRKEIVEPPTYDKASTPQLMMKSKGHTLEKFGTERFDLTRGTVIKTTVEPMSLLTWSNKGPSRAIMQMPDTEQNIVAVSLFRNIAGFMGDRPSSKAPNDHVLKMLHKILQHSLQLRDEAYCQLVRQLTDNPSEESILKGWQLMHAFLATFPMSADLKLPMLNFFADHYVMSKDKQVKVFAEAAMHYCEFISEQGARRELPTLVELEAIKGMRATQLRVQFVDDRYILVKAHSWMTARQVADQINARLSDDFKFFSPFALFELSKSGVREDEERHIHPTERVLDLVSNWARMESHALLRSKRNAKKEKHVEEFSFMYKVLCYFNIPEGDKMATELMFTQAVHDIVDSRYPCSKQDSLTLAALQLQEEYGNNPATAEEPCLYMKGAIGKYLSQQLINDADNDEAELEGEVLALYDKLSGYSKHEARMSYLDYIQAWKIYGAAYFYAKPVKTASLPEEVVVAINRRGILIVDPQTKDFLEELPYTQINRWGHSTNKLVVVSNLDGEDGQVSGGEKHWSFQTDSGKEITTLVSAYVSKTGSGGTFVIEENDEES